MKIKTTLKTATAAWAILRRAELHHFLDSGALAAIGTLEKLKINLSDILTRLLDEGVLIEFLITITDSPHYLSDSGKSIPWDDVDITIIAGLITAFFTTFLGAFKLPVSS